MDLGKAKIIVENFYKKLGFKYSMEVNEKLIQGKAPNVILNNIDDNITVSIGVFSKGSILIEFIFDKIKKIEKVAEEINKINQNYPFVKAFVLPNGYFSVTYSAICIETEEALIDAIQSIFNIVGSNKFINDLKMVTKFTKA